MEVIVIETFSPRSPFFGVYVNVNGDDVTNDGLTEPLPFSVMVTAVALPLKEPLTVIDDIPQRIPLVSVKEIVGHCPDVET